MFHFTQTEHIKDNLGSFDDGFVGIDVHGKVCLQLDGTNLMTFWIFCPQLLTVPCLDFGVFFTFSTFTLFLKYYVC